MDTNISVELKMIAMKVDDERQRGKIWSAVSF